MYHGVLNLPRALFQIHILLALLSDCTLFFSIYSMHTSIHVFTSPFSILSFSDGIKLKFVALMTYMKQ